MPQTYSNTKLLVCSYVVFAIYIKFFGLTFANHLRDKETVRAGLMRKQSSTAILTLAAQIEWHGLKLGMLREESAEYSLVLLGIESAGGVHEHTALPNAFRRAA